MTAMRGLLSMSPLAEVRGAIPAFLLLCGLFFPTSLAGALSTPLLIVHYALLLGALLFLVRLDGTLERHSLILSFSIIAILLVSTLASALHDYHPGAMIGYLTFAAACCVPFRDLRVGGWLLLVVSLVNIMLGAGIVIGVDWVNAWFVAHYSAYYPELLVFMTALHKPVLTFATHSLAAMGFYILFWLCLETYKVRGQRMFLVCAIGYTLLTLALTSSSGLTLGVLMVGQLCWLAAKRGWVVVAVVAVAAVIAATYVPWSDIWRLAGAVYGDRGAGILGRYSGGGVLAAPFFYWIEHPLRPIGFTFMPAMGRIGDSGWFEYLLRGSLPLLLCMYLALYSFLRRNLLRARDAYVFFVLVVVFEFGMTVVTRARMLYLLLFAVIYLNSLRRESLEPALTAEPAAE
jgi:hypothetical protein